MIIAVTTDGESISPRLTKNPVLTLYDVEDSIIKTKSELIIHEEEGRADTLKSRSVSTLICGAMDSESKAEIENSGIELIANVDGNAKKAVIRYLSGERLGSDKACEAEE